MLERTMTVYRDCQLDGIMLKKNLLCTSVRDFLGLGNVGGTNPWAKVQDCIQRNEFGKHEPLSLSASGLDAM